MNETHPEFTIPGQVATDIEQFGFEHLIAESEQTGETVSAVKVILQVGESLHRVRSER